MKKKIFFLVDNFHFASIANKILLLFSVTFFNCICMGQIKFDISKIKKKEVDIFKRENNENEIYVEMDFGGYEPTNKIDVKKIKKKL